MQWAHRYLTYSTSSSCLLHLVSFSAQGQLCCFLAPAFLHLWNRHRVGMPVLCPPWALSSLPPESLCAKSCSTSASLSKWLLLFQQILLSSCSWFLMWSSDYTALLLFPEVLAVWIPTVIWCWVVWPLDTPQAPANPDSVTAPLGSALSPEFSFLYVEGSPTSHSPAVESYLTYHFLQEVFHAL